MVETMLRDPTKAAAALAAIAAQEQSGSSTDTTSPLPPSAGPQFDENGVRRNNRIWVHAGRA
jgi:hypothetical protein